MVQAPEEKEKAAEKEKTEEKEEAPQKKTSRKRRNPLRHEDEYEQEGFVSFFEKK